MTELTQVCGLLYACSAQDEFRILPQDKEPYFLWHEFQFSAAHLYF